MNYNKRPSFDNSEPYSNSISSVNMGYIVVGIVGLAILIAGLLFYFYVYKDRNHEDWNEVKYEVTYSNGDVKIIIAHEYPNYHGIQNGCTFGIEPKQCYV